MFDKGQIADLKRDRGRLVQALADAGGTVGTNGKVTCPFHDDEHPSGGVHKTDSGIWIFTCHGCTWNGTERSGDAFDIVRRAQDCDFTAACGKLGLSNGHPPPPNPPTTFRSPPEPPSKPDCPIEEITDAHIRLMGDPNAMGHLWRTRGIDQATVQRFKVGITDTPGRRFWTMPITAGSLKAHRADGQSDKAWWKPKGINRNQLWPVELGPAGEVWLCPGELKALSVIGVGRSAVGITSGEGSGGRPNDLPPVAFELLHGRSVAIAPDDDATGAAWAKHASEQLGDAGIDARIVDLELDKGAGLKDIGDWIVQRLIEDAKEPEAVAATLDNRYRRSDPWFGTRVGELWQSGRMWTPVTYIRTGFRDLDAALGGGFRTRGVHMLAGKSGQAKSQLAVSIAINAARAGTPVGFFSLELGADEIAQLIAAQVADIPRGALAAGRVHGEYGDRLQKAIRSHGEMPLYILDDDRWAHGLDRDGLGKLVADGVERFGWRLILIDYLGLLISPETDQGQFDSDLRNSTALRKLARQHDVALLVVAALRKSQAAKYVAPEKITLDDLAGAGRLAYDAQTVLLASREHGYDNTGLVHVRPLKMRFAPMRENIDVQLRWRPPTGAITDLSLAQGCDRED